MRRKRCRINSRRWPSEILEEKSQRFTEQNRNGLDQLLSPLKTRLNEFQGKVEQLYDTEGKERSALAGQVQHLMQLNRTLSDDAKNLTEALRGSNKSQGNWGELILERVLEASGLRAGTNTRCSPVTCAKTAARRNRMSCCTCRRAGGS